ncbi:hypothetical protein MTO96_029203 [Rhipicephalus appendiculatus]
MVPMFLLRFTTQVAAIIVLLANVTTVASIESNQPLDLAPTIRRKVREELSLYAKVAHPSTHPSHLPPEFERNVALFSEHQAAKGIDDYDFTPRQQPHLYDRGPTYDARLQREQPLCLTTSRCGKDSIDPITKMRLTTNTIGSREQQRPIILMITNFLADSSGLGFLPMKIV